jgi:hypothetical protein
MFSVRILYTLCHIIWDSLVPLLVRFFVHFIQHYLVHSYYTPGMGHRATAIYLFADVRF